VNTAPLSVNTSVGIPQPGERGQEGIDHLRAQSDAAGLCCDVDPRVIVEDVEDLDLAAVGEAPVGDIGLPAFVGLVGAERARFCGFGMTNPRRDKIRQIVEVAGTGSTPTVVRCAAIVSAPASRPRFVRVLRSRTTRSSISRLTARGLAGADAGVANTRPHPRLQSV
jgi:hypothetical protein